MREFGGPSPGSGWGLRGFERAGVYLGAGGGCVCLRGLRELRGEAPGGLRALRGLWV